MSETLTAMGRNAFCAGAIVGIWLGFVFAHSDWPAWVAMLASSALGYGVPKFIIAPIARRIARRHEREAAR